MKYILSSLFWVNIVVSIGSIISSSIWINYNDSYITTSQFGFYLCIVFVSALMSILYITLRYSCNKCESILNDLACIISFFLTILCMTASVCITLLTKDCLNIRENKEVATQTTNYKGICNGAIVNVVFGFISLCIWFSILWITMKRLLERSKRLPALEAQASNAIARGINFN